MVELSNLPQLLLLPQSTVELLLAEHFINLSGNREKNKFLGGVLCTNERKLNEVLQLKFNELSAKYRRRPDSLTSIHVFFVKMNKAFEVKIHFPRITFEQRPKEHSIISIDKPIKSSDLVQIMFQLNL